jgi:hypothetical protein
MPAPVAAYPKDPIYSSKQKFFNASYEKRQKDLPAVWTRLYCSLAPAPFGKDVFGSAAINALSLSELQRQVLHASNKPGRLDLHSFVAHLSGPVLFEM